MERSKEAGHRKATLKKELSLNWEYNQTPGELAEEWGKVYMELPENNFERSKRI
jgi:hypothetical protein